MKPHEDAYGHALHDYYKGVGGHLILERDDGYIDASEEMQPYFAEYRHWPGHQREAIQNARGRVLDIGCGAGKHSLYLQGRGHGVLPTDISPMATKVCRLQGLKGARALSITQVSARLGRFDTVLMLGNNFGLFGSRKRARWLLRRFKALTNEGARIIAETLDPYDTTVPSHLAYHRANKSRGRMPGQIRLRVRYHAFCTPWFDYLFVSQDEMREIVADTGWRVRDLLHSRGPIYIAVIERE